MTTWIPAVAQSAQGASTMSTLATTGTYLKSAGALASGLDEASALRANASIYGTEAGIAGAQGYQAEATQRRRGAAEIGAAVAGAGQAGAGYGGSTGRSIMQSAQNAELDALNVRYKSNLQGWSYDTQAGFLRQNANAAIRSGALRAGAAFLKGASNYGGIDLG